MNALTHDGKRTSIHYRSLRNRLRRCHRPISEPSGRSGLVVSPLCLGTMTFGMPDWGADETTSRALFDTYREAGGNFVDTADVYAGGGERVDARSLHRRYRARGTRWSSRPRRRPSPPSAACPDQSRCRSSTRSSRATSSASTFRRRSMPALAVVPWSPLAGGFLTGKYARDDTADTGQAQRRETPSATRSSPTATGPRSRC